MTGSNRTVTQSAKKTKYIRIVEMSSTETDVSFVKWRIAKGMLI